MLCELLICDKELITFQILQGKGLLQPQSYKPLFNGSFSVASQEVLEFYLVFRNCFFNFG